MATPGEVTFDDGTNPAVVVGGVRWPEVPGNTYPMLKGRAIGGAVFTADLGDGTDWTDPIITFVRMTDADFVALRDFIRTTVNWSKIKFTYTDPRAVVYTNMHYWAGLPEFASSQGNRWAGQISLKKDMSL